jgi:hypothetical protein
MECPKCGFEQKDGEITCISCGIMFHKFKPRNVKTIQDKPASNTTENSTVNVESISKFHRGIIITVLVNILTAFFLPKFIGIAIIPIIVSYCYYSFNLAKSMNKNGWVYLFLGIIPVVGLFSSLILLNASNKYFKSLGLKINFLGGIKKQA